MLNGLAHNLSSDYQANYLYGLHHETNPVLIRKRNAVSHCVVRVFVLLL